MARLDDIAASLKAGNSPPPVSVRDFLWWFQAQRRGNWVVNTIRGALKRAGLYTSPDFASAYIDSQISFKLLSELEERRKKAEGIKAAATATLAVTEVESADLVASLINQDPTYKVSKLAAANQEVVQVKPDTPLSELVTILLEHDYSQVPVMTTPREVKGMVTWGLIGARLGLGLDGRIAKDFMEPHVEVRSSSSMFEVIQTVISKDYALVRNEENAVSGIITASDLSVQFRDLSEPFLLLSEIENLIRLMIDGRFTVDELKAAADPDDKERKVKGVADLTFGEYIRLLENGDRWSKFGLALDRARFCNGLDTVRRIRNDVMHFDPDGISSEDLEKLRDFTRFVSRLNTMVGSAPAKAV